MSTINVNGQNGAATSANVNVEVFYITAYGTNKVINGFKSAEEIREFNELISGAVAYEKKDFNLYYKIGDFVGDFHLDKDYHSGNYILCYGNEQVDLHFTKLMGKNIDTLVSKIFRAISEMFTKCEQKIAKEIASEKNEIIENMVENETPFDTHIFNSFGLFEYLYPNENNWGVYHWVEHYVENYYTECMKKKLVKKYNLNYDLDSHELTSLFRDYMDMLEKKWDFENTLLAFEKVVENAPKNDTPCLDNEQENETADIEYLRKVMPVVPVGVIKEKIGECVKDLNLDTMDFNEFCDKLWSDYVWEEVFTDESLEGETREYMEFNDRVRYIIENEINGVFIDRNDQVEVEVDYTPCFDNDIDIAVDRVVNTIKSYLANYEGLLMDYDGNNASICVPWDEFSENDMQMLIEDDVFEGLVIDNLVGENISDVLVYDDGVHVTVDYDKMFNKVA